MRNVRHVDVWFWQILFRHQPERYSFLWLNMLGKTTPTSPCLRCLRRLPEALQTGSSPKGLQDPQLVVCERQFWVLRVDNGYRPLDSLFPHLEG